MLIARRLFVSSWTQPNLHKQLQTMSEPYDYVFIDVGGRDAPVLRSAIGAADTILVPMIPSAADSWAAADIFRIFDSLAELGVEPDVRVVFNMQSSTIIARDAIGSIRNKMNGRKMLCLRLKSKTELLGRGRLEKVSVSSSGRAVVRPRENLEPLQLSWKLLNERANDNQSEP